MNFILHPQRTLDMLLESYHDLLGANAPLENGADAHQGWD
jgi:hypothetical protein